MDSASWTADGIAFFAVTGTWVRNYFLDRRREQHDKTAASVSNQRGLDVAEGLRSDIQNLTKTMEEHNRRMEKMGEAVSLHGERIASIEGTLRGRPFKD